MRDATYTIQREKAYLAFQYSTDPDRRDDDLLAVLILLQVMTIEVEAMRRGGKDKRDGD